MRFDAANVVWIDGVAFAPNHPRVLQHYAKNKTKDDGVSKASVSGTRCLEKRSEPHSTSFSSIVPRKGLNQTEARYLHILQERFPFGHVQSHGIKLQLAEKCWYTPDFSYTLPTGALVFVETKGAFERDDAIVKLKTAARQFPQFTFIKAKYVKGKWTETVMPK